MAGGLSVSKLQSRSLYLTVFRLGQLGGESWLVGMLKFRLTACAGKNALRNNVMKDLMLYLLF